MVMHASVVGRHGSRQTADWALCYRLAVVRATPARRVATRTRDCDACGVRERGLLLLYRARVAVRDFYGRLARRAFLIAALALGAGVGAVLLVLASDRERSPVAASAALALVVGWTYIGSGLIARRTRPENRLGGVMVFIGFAWFATFLSDASPSV